MADTQANMYRITALVNKPILEGVITLFQYKVSWKTVACEVSTLFVSKYIWQQPQNIMTEAY